MDDALTAQSSLSRIAALPSLDIDIESAAFLESVLNASSDCIKVLSLDGELVFMNGGGLKVMEVDDFDSVRGCNWTSFWEGDHHSPAASALAIASKGSTGKFTGQSNTVRGTPRWWDVTVTPILDACGTTPTHLLVISRDITEAKVAQLQRELLTKELDHRVKNLLAVVAAIAAQTFVAADRASLDAFTSRVVALADAQSLLVQTAWQSASILDVVAKAIKPHSAQGRVSYSGTDLLLSAKEALALALAIHELATNAVKYGALSNTVGIVEVNWTVADGELVVRWTESEGPDVPVPSRTGFGSRILNRNLAAEFKGRAHADYRPTGLVFTLTAPR